MHLNSTDQKLANSVAKLLCFLYVWVEVRWSKSGDFKLHMKLSAPILLDRVSHAVPSKVIPKSTYTLHSPKDEVVVSVRDPLAAAGGGALRSLSLSLSPSFAAARPPRFPEGRIFHKMGTLERRRSIQPPAAAFAIILLAINGISMNIEK